LFSVDSKQAKAGLTGRSEGPQDPHFKEKKAMKQSGLRFCTAGMALLLASAPGFSYQNEKDKAPAPGGRADERIVREVRHELVMLPYYGVFDNLTYRVDGRIVTLMGEVTRPTLKTDAGKVVFKIEGVDKVENQIKVLPLSAQDDRIRLAVYRSIYGHPGLDRYALQAVPPIHIIVDNGKVTLEGVVSTQADKDTANIRASTVSGVFSVVNHLQVEK
jgi:hyperosmotically inducible protein